MKGGFKMPGWAFPSCESTIDAIVVASIDRYMTGQGYAKVGGRYKLVLSLSDTQAMVQYVSPPDRKGNGGGVVSIVGGSYVSAGNERQYIDDFSYIRESVRNACSPLNDSLPSTHDMQALCAELVNIATNLNVDSGERGAIDSQVKTIEQLSDQIKGGQYADVSDSVTNRVRGVIASIHDVVISMSTIAGSEKDLIEAFRTNIETAMNKLPGELVKKSSSVITIPGVVAIAKWAVAAISAAAAPSPQTLVSVGLDTVEGIYKLFLYLNTKIAAVADGIGDGRDAGALAVNESIMSGEKSVNYALLKAENELAELVNTLGGRIVSSMDHFDLKPEYMKGRANNLEVVDKEQILSVAKGTLPDLAKELRALAGRVLALNFGLVFSRHNGIGRAPNGVAPEFNKLASFVASALDALAQDLEDFAYSLRKFLDALEQNEAESADRLRGAAPFYPGNLPPKRPEQKYPGLPHRGAIG
ncbi:hypothetical protein [Actinomyces sp.]